MHRPDPRLIPAVVLLATMTAALFLGCTETPTEADYTNPLDPAGAYGGDPFDAIALMSGNSVLLTWTKLNLADLAGYRVEHRVGDEGVFLELANLEPQFTSYTDSTYAPNAVNYYRVLAFDKSGKTSATSGLTPAQMYAPALVDLGGATSSAVRLVEVTVRTAMGDSVQADDDPEFGSAEFHVFDEEGEATFFWDMGPADDNGDVRSLHTRVFTGGEPSPTQVNSLSIDFSPVLFFEGSRRTLASRTTPLLISGEGVTRMRFATDRAGLAAAAWLEPAETYTGWELSAEPDSQLVFGEFDGEFGFTYVDSAWAAPDSLLDLTLILNGGSELVNGAAIETYIDAVATHIRAAHVETDLATTPWTPYDGPIAFFHDACASGLEKTVYAQVRNSWFTSAPLSGTVTWGPDDVLGVVFAGPDTVTTGQSVTLGGTAVRGTCSAPVDLVEVDLGDGWTAAAGTTEWTFPWTAPATAQTDTLWVQVTAGDETSNVQIFTIEVVEP